MPGADRLHAVPDLLQESVWLFAPVRVPAHSTQLINQPQNDQRDREGLLRGGPRWLLTLHRMRTCSVPVELFYIERGCNSRTEIWERETKCKLHAYSCIWCKDKFVLSPPCPPPPPLTPPSYKCDKGSRPASISAPPPSHPLMIVTSFWRFRPKSRTASI